LHSSHERLFIAALVVVILISLVTLICAIISLLRYHHRQRLAHAIRKESERQSSFEVSSTQRTSWKIPLDATPAPSVVQGGRVDFLDSTLGSDQAHRAAVVYL
jgi:hypothetical protein